MFDTISHPHQRAFLVAFSECGNVKEAAALADISREAHYDWRKRDADYRAAFAEATEMAADALEDDIRERSLSGMGSDQLLMFLLRGLRPEKYANREKRELSGPGGAPITVAAVDLSRFSNDELALLEQFASKAALEPRSDPSGAGETLALEAARLLP